LRDIRKLMGYLPSNCEEKPPVQPVKKPDSTKAEALDTLVPENPNKPYDMKEVIEGVVDGESFYEVQPEYAANMITGFARLDGAPIGVVANQPLALAGVLCIESSLKAARFVRFCDAFNIPLLVLATLSSARVTAVISGSVGSDEVSAIEARRMSVLVSRIPDAISNRLVDELVDVLAKHSRINVRKC